MARRKKQSTVGWFNACRTGSHYFCKGEYLNDKTDVVFCQCPCHDVKPQSQQDEKRKA